MLFLSNRKYFRFDYYFLSHKKKIKKKIIFQKTFWSKHMKILPSYKPFFQYCSKKKKKIFLISNFHYFGLQFVHSIYIIVLFGFTFLARSEKEKGSVWQAISNYSWLSFFFFFYQIKNILTFLHFLYNINYFLLLFK